MRPDPCDLRLPLVLAGNSSAASLRREPDPRRPADVSGSSIWGPISLSGERGRLSDWVLWYFGFSRQSIAAVFAFLQFTTFGMGCPAPVWADRETVACWASNIDQTFTLMFGLAARCRGLAGAMVRAHCVARTINMGNGLFWYLASLWVVVGGWAPCRALCLPGF